MILTVWYGGKVIFGVIVPSLWFLLWSGLARIVFLPLALDGFESMVWLLGVRFWAYCHKSD